MSEHGNWQMLQNEALMTRRFDFASYAQTRAFLDALAKLSEKTGYYPDLNFAKTHVSVSVAPAEKKLGTTEYAFARQVDALAEFTTAKAAS
ncbi:MAG: 4a-hydroxytetrahydrobiopterin dehydratase [Gallionellaceae bacterium]|nr:4a-hydroxytetrahydrobiopterin dehydratase [Gallionellaceae bacterium]